MSDAERKTLSNQRGRPRRFRNNKIFLRSRISLELNSLETGNFYKRNRGYIYIYIRWVFRTFNLRLSDLAVPASRLARQSDEAALRKTRRRRKEGARKLLISRKCRNCASNVFLERCASLRGRPTKINGGYLIERRCRSRFFFVLAARKRAKLRPDFSGLALSYRTRLIRSPERPPFLSFVTREGGQFRSAANCRVLMAPG